MIGARGIALATVTVTLIGLSGHPRAQQIAGEKEGKSSVSVELAFSRTRLSRQPTVAVSSDGAYVAFVVRQPTATRPTYARWMDNGVPGFTLDNRVVITRIGGGEIRQVGPDGVDCWRPSFAPNSRALAFYCHGNRGTELWLADVERGSNRRVGTVSIKAKLFVGDAPQWSSDGQELYVALVSSAVRIPGEADRAVPTISLPAVTVYRNPGESAANSDDERSTRSFLEENAASIAAVNISTGAIRVLLKGDANPPPGVFQLSPSGKWIAYLSVFHRSTSTVMSLLHDLLVVPAVGGDTRSIARDLPVPNNDYTISSYAWSPVRDQLFWISDQRLWTADLTTPTNQPRQLATAGALVVEPLVVSRDGLRLIVGAKTRDRDPGPTALAIVPIADASTKLIELPVDATVQGFLTTKYSTLWQPDSASAALVVKDLATARDSVLRVDIAEGRISTLWKGSGRFRAADVSKPLGETTADHRFFVTTFEDYARPEGLYTLDAAGALRPLTNLEPRLAGIDPGTVETFTVAVPQFDGTQKMATTAVLLPRGSKRGDRLPTVVVQYPGSNISSAAAQFAGGMPFTVPASAFTARGYCVLLADAPIGPIGKSGNPIAELVDVLLPQIRRAGELGYIDMRRVAIVGQSYGGFGAASVVTQTNMFRAAIAVSGVFDLTLNYGWMTPAGMSLGGGWAETGQGRMGATLWSDTRRFIDNSPYFRADRINTPMLLVHGSVDASSPVEDAKKFFNALKRLGKPVELAVYQNEGHVVYDWAVPNAVDAVERMLAFLDRNLTSERLEK
jgi:dipeptidyl aminopeptidase/acylaminoacyl peptidase